jgi:hypothetical protein
MSNSKINDRLSSLSVKTSKSGSSFDYEATTRTKNGKVSSFILSTYLPIYQSTVRKNIKNKNKTESSVSLAQKKDASVQNTLLEYRFDVGLAANLTISQQAVFPMFHIRRFSNKPVEYSKHSSIRKSSTISGQNQSNTRIVTDLRDVGVQTYTPSVYLNEEYDSLVQFDLDEANKTTREKLLENLAYSFNSKHVIWVLDELSEEALVFLAELNEKEAQSKSIIVKSLLKLRNHETFNNLLENISRPQNNAQSISFLNKLITIANSGNSKRKIKGMVRFEDVESGSINVKVRNEYDAKRRRLVLERFRKAVKFVIFNRDWFKSSNKDKRDEYEKFFLNEEFSYAASSLNNKKIQLLFNKNEFRAQKNLTSSLITDLHRQILSKEPGTRDKHQIEFLLNLVCTIPRLSVFPKYVCLHIAQMIKLLAYEKGNFFFVLNEEPRF